MLFSPLWNFDGSVIFRNGLCKTRCARLWCARIWFFKKLYICRNLCTHMRCCFYFGLEWRWFIYLFCVSLVASVNRIWNWNIFTKTPQFNGLMEGRRIPYSRRSVKSKWNFMHKYFNYFLFLFILFHACKNGEPEFMLVMKQMVYENNLSAASNLS